MTGRRLIAAWLLIGVAANGTFYAVGGWSALWFDAVWLVYALYASRLGNPVRSRWGHSTNAITYIAIFSYIPPYAGVPFWLFLATFIPLALFALSVLSILKRLEPGHPASQTTPLATPR